MKHGMQQTIKCCDIKADAGLRNVFMTAVAAL